MLSIHDILLKFVFKVNNSVVEPVLLRLWAEDVEEAVGYVAEYKFDPG